MKSNITTISLVAAALVCGAGALTARAGVASGDVKDAGAAQVVLNSAKNVQGTQSA